MSDSLPMGRIVLRALVLAVVSLVAVAWADRALAITCKHESPTSQFECILPQWGPWRYDSGNHFSGSVHPPVDTLEEAAANAIQEIADYFGPKFCSYDYQVTSVPWASWHTNAGISDAERILFYLEGTAWWTDNPVYPCAKGQQQRVEIDRTRPVFCPPGWYGSSSTEQGWFCFRDYHTPRCIGQCADSGAKATAPNGAGPQNTRDPAWIGTDLNVHTLDRYQTEVDWSSGGVRPLTLRRNYLSSGFPRLPQVAIVNDGLGGYWRTSFNARLEHFSNATITSKVAMRNDGSTLYFYRSGSVWSGRPEQTASLVDLISGGSVTGWRLTANDDSFEDYDLQGRLVALVETSGWRYDLAYNAAGLLATVVDSLGRQLSYTYDARGLLQSILTPDGTVRYRFDAKGQLASVTYPDGATRQYRYMEPGYLATNSYAGLLTGIFDENGNRHSTTRYDSGGRAWQIERGNGANRYSISWSGGTNVTDPLGTTRLYGKTPIKGFWRTTGLSQACPSCGEAANAASIGYDANGNVVSRTSFTNKKGCYAYDPVRNLETARVEGLTSAESCASALAAPPDRPDVRKVTTTWNATWRLPATIVEPAPGGTRTITFAYDGSGNRIRKTVVAPKNDGTAATITRVWSWTYGSLGRVASATDPRGKVTRMTYHPDDDTNPGRRGQLATVTNPLGHVTRYSAYDAANRVTSMTDPNGLVSSMTYDARGRLTSRTVGGEITTYSYDLAGQLVEVELADGAVLSYVYDTAHRLTEVNDGLGNRIVYTLDGMGNRIREESFDPSNVLARVRSRVYDNLNRLAREVGALSQATVMTRDGNGNRLTSTDPLNHATASSYDALNRLLTVTDPGNGVTRYVYDKAGNLTMVTDPRNLVTAYTYDGLDNPVALVSPDTGTTTRTFDAAGNVLTATDSRGVLSTFAYDDASRVTQVTYAKAGFPTETHIYAWDGGPGGAPNAKGRISSITDPSGTTAWTFAAQGRVASRSQTAGGVTLTTGYTWSNGRLTGMTTPSGQSIGYSYANGRIVGVAINGVPLISGGSYEPFGPVSAWRWGNGHLTYRDHDTDGRLVTWEYRNGVSVMRRDLTWDNANRITAITDPASAASSSTYGYDALDRLTSALGGGTAGSSRTYAYDAVGNRTSATFDAAITTYGYASTSNRLLSLSGATTRNYTYDSAGNPTIVGALLYEYNLAGRMASVSGGASATYKTNALGQRVAKTIGATTTRYVYDEVGRLVGEYDQSGILVQETVWIDDMPIATLRPTGTGKPTPVAVYYVHADHLGGPRAITRPSDDAIVWQWENADPFGNNPANENPFGIGAFRFDLRFPGQQYDLETASHYNYFRDYAPSIGRYFESDPLGLWGGVNTYGYVRQSPIHAADIYGLDETIWRPGPGRGIFDGPRNGNWCGGNWSGGQVPSLYGGRDGTKTPTDSMDRCCMVHDKCYNKCDSILDAGARNDCRIGCDRPFIGCLGALSDDCTKWPEPPRVGTESDSQLFRDDALRFFNDRIGRSRPH